MYIVINLPIPNIKVSISIWKKALKIIKKNEKVNLIINTNRQK